MAKVKSIFKIQGTLGDLTFGIDRNGNAFVRQKSSLDRERVLRDPAFVRTRENSKEFGSANAAGTLLRRGAAAFLRTARDPGHARRMLSLMCKARDWDLESVRGERTVGRGLLLPQGRQLLKGFDFNKDAPLDRVLRCPYVLEPGFVFHIRSLVPRRMLQAPKAATHATFRSCAVLVDFGAGTATTAYSPAVMVPLDLQSIDVMVAPDAVPTGEGILFWLLLVEFSQELNGLQYPMYERTHNALHLLDVVPAAPRTVSYMPTESKATLPLLADLGNKSVGKKFSLLPSYKRSGNKMLCDQETVFQPLIRGIPFRIRYGGCMLANALELPRDIAPVSYSRPTVPERKPAMLVDGGWESLSEKIIEFLKIDDS